MEEVAAASSGQEEEIRMVVSEEPSQDDDPFLRVCTRAQFRVAVLFSTFSPIYTIMYFWFS